ncbi:MAG: hypothetical protein Q7S53_03240 [bacterium]|nr:hypothetical protein [bacterium]
MENENQPQPNIDGIRPNIVQPSGSSPAPQQEPVSSPQGLFQEPEFKKPQKSSKKRIIILAVTLAALIIGGGTVLGIWSYLGNQAKMKKTETKTATQSEKPKEAATVVSGRLKDYIYTVKEQNVANSSGVFEKTITKIGAYDSKDGHLVKEFAYESKLGNGENKETIDNFQVVGNNLYARSSVVKIPGQRVYLGIIKFDGKERKEVVKFSQTDSLDRFRVSPDEKYIAWGSFATGADGMMTLNLSDINGTLIKKLRQVSGGSTVNYSSLNPFYWSSDGKNIYYIEQGGGRGGYVLFGNSYTDVVSKINIESGSEIVFNSNKDIGYDNIDSLENLYFKKDDRAADSGAIIIKNKSGDLVKEVPITKYWPNQRSGNFVRNGDEIYFAVAKGNPDNEEFKLIKHDLKTSKDEEMTDVKGFYFPQFMYDESNLLITKMNSLVLFNVREKKEKKLLEWTAEDALTILN